METWINEMCRTVSNLIALRNINLLLGETTWGRGLRHWSELRANMKVSETTQGEKQQERESGRNGPEVNGNTGETALISRCRNKTMNISPSE